MISLAQTSLTSVRLLESDFRIKISDTTLNNWMKAEEVLSPKYLMNRMNIQDVLNQNMQVR